MENYKTWKKIPRFIHPTQSVVIAFHGFGSHIDDLPYLLFGNNVIEFHIQGTIKVNGSNHYYRGNISVDNIVKLTDDINQSINDFIKEYHLEEYEFVLAGFGQGVIIAQSVLALNHHHFERIIFLNGACNPFNPLNEKKKTGNAFLSQGLMDASYPPPNADELCTSLENAGINCTFTEYKVAHGLSPEVPKDIKRWLTTLL